jgi:hypothetical protein
VCWCICKRVFALETSAYLFLRSSWLGFTPPWWGPVAPDRKWGEKESTVAAAINAETLPMVRESFGLLDPDIKAKVLLSLLHVPREKVRVSCVRVVFGHGRVRIHNVRVRVCAFEGREVGEVLVRGVLNQSQRLHPLPCCVHVFYWNCASRVSFRRVGSSCCFLGCGVALRFWAMFLSTVTA